MSNKNLCILAAILIIAAIFAERSNVCGVGNSHSATVANTRLHSDSVKLDYTINSYNQRIVRTVRCLVGAGTPPSLITRQVNKLYEERERAIGQTDTTSTTR